VAPLSVAGAFGIKLLFDPWAAVGSPFLLQFAAVMVSAWCGGLGPGLLATGLAAFGIDLLMLWTRNPLLAHDVRQQAQIFVFCLEGGLLSWIVDRMQQAQRRSEADARAGRESEEAERRFSAQLTALHDVSNRLSTSPSFDALCRGAIELGRGRLGFDRLGLWFIHGDPTVAHGSFGVDERGQLRDERGSQVRVSPGSLAGQVLLANRPCAFREEGPVLNDCAEIVGRADQAIAGLWDGKSVIGFITADNLISHEPITERERELLTLYAAVLGHLCSIKRAEEALQTSERRFRALIEKSWDAVALMDARGTIHYVSPTASRIVGWEPEELVGRHCYEGIHPEDLPDIRESFAHFSENPGAVLSGEYRYQHKDGSWPWIEGTITNLLHDPAVGAIVGNYRDVTAQKLLSDELHARAEELARADRAKDHFLAMLAHELRNPMAPILHAVDLLEQTAPPDPAVIRARDIIQRQVTHQAHLVDDLLNVSRIARGKIALQKISLDLRQLVHDTVEDHRSALETAGLRIERELPEEPLWVEGDPVRLSQVLGNLLQNAVKFTDPGGRVTVRLQHDEDRAHGVVSVRDTGIGMDPEILSSVFETFTQADRSLARSRGGLGLGLALVKGLVELHGGEVSAESAGPGRGSVFTIRLPLIEAAEAIALPAPAPAAGAVSLRVLVVEDNRDAADALHDLLELAHHEVEVAYSGRDGVELAVRFRPDVVLCDLGLPEMDGYAVARALRQRPETRDTWLIAVTGYGQEEDRRRCHEAGFDLHVTKPVDIARIRQILASPPRGGGELETEAQKPGDEVRSVGPTE
jgi:PAS domain S-box-containing protein